MTRSLLALIALLVFSASSWCGEPATPAAKAADYSATPPVPGAPVAPAVQAGLDQAGKTAAAGWHLTDVGSVLAIGIPVVLTFLAKMPLPPALAAALGPWGGFLTLILGLLKGIAQPYADKQKEQLVASHSDALQELVRLTQLVSNFHTVAEWKAHLRENMSDKNQATIGALIASLEDQGIDHAVLDDLLRPESAAQPLPVPAPALAAAAK